MSRENQVRDGTEPKPLPDMLIEDEPGHHGPAKRIYPFGNESGFAGHITVFLDEETNRGKFLINVYMGREAWSMRDAIRLKDALQTAIDTALVFQSLEQSDGVIERTDLTEPSGS